MQQIVVCVCTRERPKMLARCLEGLFKLVTPDGTFVTFVVVDNEPEPNNKALVLDMASRLTERRVYYVHEPRPGISQARNAALAKALYLKADWVAFIDDDERPADDFWLGKLYWAAWEHGTIHPTSILNRNGWRTQYAEAADVVAGLVKYEFPMDCPRWRQRKPWGHRGRVDGQLVKTASTNNCLFKARLIEETPYGLGLRFDEGLGLMGGEDTAFFIEAMANDCRMVLSTEATVVETVPWERLTMRAQWRHSFRVGMSKVEVANLLGNPVKRNFPLRKGAAGVGKLMLTPLAFCVGAGLRCALSGWRNVAEAWGVMQAWRGKKFFYYTEIHGE